MAVAGDVVVMLLKQVSYYLPGYLPPEQVFVPPAAATDSIVMGAYTEQGLAFEGEIEQHCLCNTPTW